MLPSKQSGYRQQHNTQQQLLYLTHNLYKRPERRIYGNIPASPLCQILSKYIDISRYYLDTAFGPLLEWVKSYLRDRKQRVTIGNTFSTTLTINSGCPQGSVLGPLLALMYLNKLSTQTQHDILLFADDTSIYAIASFKNENFLTAQHSLPVV